MALRMARPRHPIQFLQCLSCTHPFRRLYPFRGRRPSGLSSVTDDLEFYGYGAWGRYSALARQLGELDERRAT